MRELFEPDKIAQNLDLPGNIRLKMECNPLKNLFTIFPTISAFWGYFSFGDTPKVKSSGPIFLRLGEDRSLGGQKIRLADFQKNGTVEDF